jgi:hypothetical protein
MSRRVLSRPLSDAERGVLTQLLDSELQIYTADPAAADALVHVGDSPAPESLAAPDLAAWTLVGSALFNLDEALNK